MRNPFEPKDLTKQLVARVIAISLVLTVCKLPSITAQETRDAVPLGPLGGRNLYAAHLGWFSFPSEKAAADPLGTLRIRNGLYFINEFKTYSFDADTAPLSENEKLDLVAVDYESTVWEWGIDWQATEDWRFSADWRLHFRYGGFFDRTIEWWHEVLGVPNAGREFFPNNRSYWNIRTAEGQSYSGSGNTVASGDLDLRAVWSFYSGSVLNFAGSAAVKLPTGDQSGGFGSGYPDFAIALLVDYQPQRKIERSWSDSGTAVSFQRWAFYTNAGLIIPTGPAGRLIWQFMPAVEFRVGAKWSILVQMNLQRSPIIGDEKYVDSIFGRTDMYALPQTDIKIGVKGRLRRLEWQVYIEEDPLTFEGPDVLLFIGLGVRIR